MHRLATIDAHCAGAPLRLVVDGLPSPDGRTMAERQAWAETHLDGWRTALMREPRGHADMVGALFTEPAPGDGHAGLLFMQAERWPRLSGHGVIAAATIALTRGLVWPGAERELRLDTAAGRVVARITPSVTDAPVVAFRNVPAFVVEGGVAVRVDGRIVPVDLAFGGAFHAIVDAEAVGIGLEPQRTPELRSIARRLVREIERAVRLTHPSDETITGLEGVVFTAPPQGDAQLRTVSVDGDGVLDRSPGGTATAAVMAVLDEMGLLGDDVPFVHEGLLGTTFTGRIVGRRAVGERAAISVETEAAAWVTGEHTFVLDGDDPLRAGFLLG